MKYVNDIINDIMNSVASCELHLAVSLFGQTIQTGFGYIKVISSIEIERLIVV